jgi:hypothetical protein
VKKYPVFTRPVRKQLDHSTHYPARFGATDHHHRLDPAHPQRVTEGFAKDLLRLRDPATREKYRERGVQNARRFSAKKIAEEYLSLYRQLGMAA